MRTREELIAFRFNGDNQKIAKEIGAESVNYISNEDFIKATNNKNHGCNGCITGIYPVDKNGQTNSYLAK